MAQALGFAFLLAGGVLVLAGWTGASPAQVVKGEAGTKGAPLGGSSASAAGAAGTVNSAGLASPFPAGAGVKQGRTDQGVDFSAPAGTPLFALGNALVSRIDPNFYNGQPAVYLKYLSGPLAGKESYYAEQLTPTVKTGQRVSAGQQIGTVASSGTGLELGWGAGGIPAAKSEGYTEGQETKLGQSFERLLAGLGL